MPKVLLKEQIANYRNTQSHLWTAMLVTISGSFALWQSSHSISGKSVAIIGILISFLIFYCYLNLDDFVKNLTKRLED